MKECAVEDMEEEINGDERCIHGGIVVGEDPDW